MQQRSFSCRTSLKEVKRQSFNRQLGDLNISSSQSLKRKGQAHKKSHKQFRLSLPKYNGTQKRYLNSFQLLYIVCSLDFFFKNYRLQSCSQYCYVYGQYSTNQINLQLLICSLIFFSFFLFLAGLLNGAQAGLILILYLQTFSSFSAGMIGTSNHIQHCYCFLND